MIDSAPAVDKHNSDSAPGDERPTRHELAQGLVGYLVGLAIAALLTAIAFYLAAGRAFWQPSIPVALLVLAVAQMGAHLVFFLHLTTAPDNVNNVLALAFGLLIVILVVGGSLFIMTHLNHNMLPMDQIIQMQR